MNKPVIEMHETESTKYVNMSFSGNVPKEYLDVKVSNFPISDIAIEHIAGDLEFHIGIRPIIRYNPGGR